MYNDDGVIFYQGVYACRGVLDEYMHIQDTLVTFKAFVQSSCPD